MAISIKAELFRSYQKADGTYPVKIRVYYNGASKYLPTNITVKPSQLTGKMKVKDQALKATIDDLEGKYRKKVSKIPLDENLTLDKIVQALKAKTGIFTLDFPTYFAGIAGPKPKGSRANYMCALHSLCNFMKMEHFDISLITSSLMHGYEKYLISKHGEGARAITLYIGAIEFVHSRAREEFNNEELGDIKVPNVFSSYSIPKRKPGRANKPISRDTLKLMIAQRKGLTGKERLGVDLYLMSFSLMGTNTPDLHSCTIEGDVVHYERTKTRARREDRAEMFIRIEPEVKEFLQEHIKGNRFDFSDRFKTYDALGRTANDGLKLWCGRNNIPPFTIYSGRHTWGTIAFSLGIDMYTINACLCHVDPNMRATNIYVERDWRILWEANSRVIREFF